MKATDRAIVALLFAVASLPLLWAVATSLEALSQFTLAEPSAPSSYGRAFLAWWIGIIGTYLLGQAVANPTSTTRSRVLASFPSATGIVACVWLEMSAYFDPKQIVPVGTAVIPYFCAFALAVVLERSNQQQNSTVQ
jgi:hypothetical protein